MEESFSCCLNSLYYSRKVIICLNYVFLISSSGIMQVLTSSTDEKSDVSDKLVVQLRDRSADKLFVQACFSSKTSK